MSLRPYRAIAGARARRGLVLAAAGVLSFLIGLPAQAWPPLFGNREAEPRVDWSYSGPRGPEHWAELSPRFAACDGERQSPVDLREGRPLAYSPLSFHYRSNALAVINDGRSVRVEYGRGSYLRTGGRDYELREFHFHVPAEHLFHGIRPDMEMHLVHRDARGNVAVVAVPMKAGRRMNSTLTRIWEHIPRQGGPGFYGRQKGINPVFLLPQERGYFTYVGSLTEPPCTQGVEWFVLMQPLEVDVSYVQELHRIVGHNARPVQPLNGRPVLAVLRR